MTDVTIPDITLRTTSDGQAFAHGLAIGTGASVDQAVNALADEAQRQAQEIERERLEARRASRTGGRGLPVPAAQHDGAKPERWYEVADVRLACDPADAARTERWVAYGTLRSTRQRPGGGGYWDPTGAD